MRYTRKMADWTIIIACTLLVMAVGLGFSVNNAFAQVSASVPTLTTQSKAQTDRVLDEIDDEKIVENTTDDMSSEDPSLATNNSPRIAPYTTLYIEFVAEEGALDSVAEDMVPSQKIFLIDRDGYITLENIGRFKLSGLTGAEAVMRLSAEPVFSNMDITLSILPVDLDESLALEPFGKSIFTTTADSNSNGDIPVPMDYVVGPGDEVLLQLFGATNATHTLEVSRDGIIDFPEIGPVPVAGQTFEELRISLAKLASQRLIGVETSVTLGALRSINVLVVGEVESPGNKLVGALSSVVDVLAASGGITDIGSYRDITIERSGNKVASIDLYELLMSGSSGGQLRLQSGDVIFVPPSRQRVFVSGEVNRSAIYQIKYGDTLETVMELAGGLAPLADSGRVQIERASSNKRILMEVDFSTPGGRGTRINSGDRIYIGSLGSVVAGVVQVHGAVAHPGRYAWSEGLQLTHLLRSAGQLNSNADRGYSILKRQLLGGREIRADFLNLAEALGQPGGSADILLQPGDEIFVVESNVPGQRQYLLSPLLESLNTQARLSSPAKIVSVEGGVFEPGFYPLTGNMRVSDLITAAGGLGEGAVTHTAEITRRVRGNGGEFYSQHIPINLQELLAGNVEADLILSSHDVLIINNDPRGTLRDTVEITGEVLYPGIYPIARGEQLSKLIDRAGGLTDLAFPEGAFLSRVSVKEQEAREMLSLADHLEKGMKATVLERADENLRPAESAVVATEIIDLLRSAQPPGRVVIDLPTILSDTHQGMVSDVDIVLKTGDTLHIPEVPQVVSVVGEVNHPTTHAFVEGESMMDYVEKSGGITPKADEDLVYIIHANGAASHNIPWWKGGADISLGDIVMVPLNVEKIRDLKKWTEIASIFGNAVTPAAQVISAAALWRTSEANQTQADAYKRSVEEGRITPQPPTSSDSN